MNKKNNTNHLLPRQTPTAANNSYNIPDEYIERTERTHVKQDNRANLKNIMFKSKLKTTQSKESKPMSQKLREAELLSGSGDTKSLERVNGARLQQKLSQGDHAGDVLSAGRRPA